MFADEIRALIADQGSVGKQISMLEQHADIEGAFPRVHGATTLAYIHWTRMMNELEAAQKAFDEGK